MRRSWGVAFAFLGAVVAGSPANASYTGEVLMMPLPHGFKLGSSMIKGQVKMAEFVPQAETVEDWSQMLTQNIFRGKGGRDPDELPTLMTEGWKEACPGGDVKPVVRTLENGYAAAIWNFHCPLNPATGKPESMWLKVISAGDSLYSVQYSYRQVASAQMARSATAYLEGVSVCDRRTRMHPCPANLESALPVGAEGR